MPLEKMYVGGEACETTETVSQCMSGVSGVCVYDSLCQIAVLTAGQSTHNLGVILSANSAALRLLGYTKQEAVGQNLNTIVPEPISSVHHQYLRDYIRTGNEVMQSTSRIMFVKHKLGHVIPILQNSSTLEKHFIGFMQPLVTGEEYIWFYSKTFVISAATENSLALMGVCTTGST
jgi:PAS domain S-box-containing protein